MARKQKRDKNSGEILFGTHPKRQFRFMKTLDMYILREFMIVYICLNLAFCILFLISDLVNKLGDFGPYTTTWDIIYYFILRQPGDIKFVLPIALLLACMYAMAKLGMHNEITAMRACGISIIRLGVPIYIIGLIVSGFNFWFNESLVPNCNRKAAELIKLTANPHYWQIKMRMTIYRSPDYKRTWLIQSFNQTFMKQSGVQLKVYDNKGNLQDELYAKNSEYVPKTGWKFFNVTLVKYQTIKLVDAYSKETLGKVQVLTIPTTQKFKVFGPKNKEFKLLGDIVETPTDMILAQKDPGEITSADIMRKLDMSEHLPAATKNSLLTELYTRFAFPWVCVLAVLLGVPMAGSNERKGVMLSVVAAILVVVAYQVISQIFQILGTRGAVPPIVGGLAPTIALALYVFYNLRKHK
ncbi:MAG: YjgP/YjgQ family permease [bacterium]|nr:YjgP/YjgQ family permease [bacterium]